MRTPQVNLESGQGESSAVHAVIASRVRSPDNTGMDPVLLLVVLFVGAFALKRQDQRRRIGLLGEHLQHYRIEGLMETLLDGYLRALDEDDPTRADAVWGHLHNNERELAEQFERVAADIGKLTAEVARVSTLPWSIPFGVQLFPAASFDLRAMFRVHADGISRAADEAVDADRKHRAFTMSAEIYLMQHTCHWFCRSKTVASARLVGRHRTTYAQVLAAVSPQTRAAYESVLGGRTRGN